jgi:hypothetical protein
MILLAGREGSLERNDSQNSVPTSHAQINFDLVRARKLRRRHINTGKVTTSRYTEANYDTAIHKTRKGDEGREGRERELMSTTHPLWLICCSGGNIDLILSR